MDMMSLFQPIAWLFGYVLRFINSTIGFHNYLLTIFWFTLFTRILTFPFQLKNQKSMMDRARLAPKIERLQKKYGRDQKKFQEKQQALYEKENVSMTGGCLPLVLSMVVLMGVLADIYQPLQYLTQVEPEAITTAITEISYTEKDGKKYDVDGKELSEKDLVFYISPTEGSNQSYYRELHLLNRLDKGDNAQKIQAALAEHYKDNPEKATETWENMESIKGQLQLFGISLLDNPWQNTVIPNWLWIIAIISGLSAFASAVLSNRYSKLAQPREMTADMSPEQQRAQGCTKGCSNGMIYFMPLFSLYITFVVPGAVGIYWIFSNIIALGQTVVLNKIYDPAKAREEAQKAYDERRAQKLADKRRLAESRKAEAEALAEEEAKAREEAAKKAEAAKAKKPVPSSQNPNKQKRREEKNGDDLGE